MAMKKTEDDQEVVEQELDQLCLLASDWRI